MPQRRRGPSATRRASCAAARQHAACCRTRSPLTEEDYTTEYLDLILRIKVVANLEEAIAHIERYGSHHTDAIVTNDWTAARRFTAAVDSAAVIVNASTRFNDGYEIRPWRGDWHQHGQISCTRAVWFARIVQLQIYRLGRQVRKGSTDSRRVKP